MASQVNKRFGHAFEYVMTYAYTVYILSRFVICTYYFILAFIPPLPLRLPPPLPQPLLPLPPLLLLVLVQLLAP